MPAGSDATTIFLAGAHSVAGALADPSVADAWSLPSVLEDQAVSSLAAHLARGGVWAVADYLDAGPPPGPVDFDSASEYFAALVSNSSVAANRAIRERSAAIASIGREELLRTLGSRLEDLEPRLLAMDPDELIAVIAGKVMRLGDYLETRIVEQTVHLDDLARSLNREPWPLPAGAADLTIAIGVEVASRRSGKPALVRALYRQGSAEGTLPVL
jgi:hypothetical protein